MEMFAQLKIVLSSLSAYVYVCVTLAYIETFVCKVHTQPAHSLVMSTAYAYIQTRSQLRLVSLMSH